MLARTGRSLVVGFGSLVLLASTAWAGVGDRVADFALNDVHGKPVALAGLADKPAVVLVFIGTECPLAKLYGPRLAELAREFSDKGVALLGISSNQQDSITELAHFARVHGIEFPILKDLNNELADRLGAQRTPEVFVLDRDRVVRYHGRIDDQYGFQESRVGYQLAAARRRDLALALDELLAGKPVSQAETSVAGCIIGRVRAPQPGAQVTFSKHIAPIFNKHCVLCHREGEIAPFVLGDYATAAGWAEMIREVVDEQRMPPWHADPQFGTFVNDARLSAEEKQLIFDWVAAGAPEGDRGDLPEPPKFTDGWMIPTPDEIVYMRDEPFDVPAEGVVDYQRFIVDPGWTEDRWIRAIEPRPGNPAVVHHIVMYIQPPDGPRTGAAGRLRTDWLAAYAPGLRPQWLPESMARLVPKGSKLVFELHYTPNGVAQTDRSYLGLVFADGKSIQRELAVKNAGNFTFRIPPGDGNYQVESNFTFRENSLLWSVSPHMHLRGKDFRYDLVYPDGKTETVLSVPRYDFAWQTTYVFTEPKRLPKGTRLHCVAHFDNSEDNLNNPDPKQQVRWGEQTFEEMMFGWFEMALADQDLTKPQPPPVARTKQFLKNIETLPAGGDEQLGEAARKSLTSDEQFKFFAYYLLDSVPQVDRVCVSYVDGEDLRLRSCEELNGVRTLFRTTSTSFKARGQALADVLSSSGPVVYSDLTKAPGSLMQRLAKKGLASSVHVPVEIDGRRMIVSFWSIDPDAFPPQAASLLAGLAQLMASGEKP